MKKVIIKNNPENEIPLEIIAEAIVEISKSMEVLKNSRLTQSAILLLIHDNCRSVGGKFDKKKPTIKQILAVIESISTLKNQYIKSVIKK